MSIEHNLQIVNNYFDAMSAGDIDGTFELLDDKGSWWQNGRRFLVPMPKFKEGARATLRLVPMKFTVLSTIAKDDKVLAEVESHAENPDGGHYNNVYCFVFTMSGDRILNVRQYADTATARTLPEEITALNRHADIAPK